MTFASVQVRSRSDVSITESGRIKSLSCPISCRRRLPPILTIIGTHRIEQQRSQQQTTITNDNHTKLRRAMNTTQPPPPTGTGPYPPTTTTTPQQAAKPSTSVQTLVPFDIEDGSRPNPRSPWNLKRREFGLQALRNHLWAVAARTFLALLCISVLAYVGWVSNHWVEERKGKTRDTPPSISLHIPPYI